jgi:hypothetical protein
MDARVKPAHDDVRNSLAVGAEQRVFNALWRDPGPPTSRISLRSSGLHATARQVRM